MARYDQRFYDTIRPGCRSSAETVGPRIAEILQPSSVLDIGCGEGWWGTTIGAAAGGVSVIGIDGPGVPDTAPIRTRPAATFIEHDLASTLPDTSAGLVVCLEVAEHLPPERARSFIAELCRRRSVVVFSAAMPGQGGTGHVNCQPPGYWVDLFADHKYAVSGALRLEFWDDPRVEPWYRSNLLVATPRPDRLPELFDTPLAHPWHLVHPDLWITR